MRRRLIGGLVFACSAALLFGLIYVPGCVSEVFWISLICDITGGGGGGAW